MLTRGKFNSEKNKYVKVVPDNIIDLMDPIVLAHMIQGFAEMVILIKVETE